MGRGPRLEEIEASRTPGVDLEACPRTFDGAVDDNLALQHQERHGAWLAALGEEASRGLPQDNLLTLVIYTDDGAREEGVAEDQLRALVPERIERWNGHTDGRDVHRSQRAKLDALELAEAETYPLRRTGARDLHERSEFGASCRRRVDGRGARPRVEKGKHLASADLRADEQLVTEVSERQPHAPVGAGRPLEDEAVRRRLGARRAFLWDGRAGRAFVHALEAVENRRILAARDAPEGGMLGALTRPAYAVVRLGPRFVGRDERGAVGLRVRDGQERPACKVEGEHGRAELRPTERDVHARAGARWRSDVEAVGGIKARQERRDVRSPQEPCVEQRGDRLGARAPLDDAWTGLERPGTASIHAAARGDAADRYQRPARLGSEDRLDPSGAPLERQRAAQRDRERCLDLLGASVRTCMPREEIADVTAVGAARGC